MLRLPLCAVPMLCGIVFAVAATAPAADDGFASLFNGKNLDGWEGEPGYWSVQDGAITGQTTPQKPLRKATYLFCRKDLPANFELRAEFRMEGNHANSGINFRSQQLPGWDVKGYQADMEAGPTYSGILYECNQRAIMTKRGQKVVIAADGARTVSPLSAGGKAPNPVKANAWNEYVIIARGPEIILKINGVVTTEVTDREKGKAAADGIVSLQLHPGPPMKVQYKNIRVKPLP